MNLLKLDLRKLQGVRFNVGISSIRLKSTIFLQNWHDMAHFDENTPPFEILSQISENHFRRMKKIYLCQKAYFSAERLNLLLKQKLLNKNFV